MLINGKIPKGMECPFIHHCDISKQGSCNHNGEDHSCDFSCAVARSFELMLVQVKEGAIGGKTFLPRPSFVGRMGFVSERDGVVWIKCLEGDEEICVTRASFREI
jgi:hypothetical protein